MMVYFMGATTLRLEFEVHIYISYTVILGLRLNAGVLLEFPMSF